jgi:hypothetical protein
MHLQNYKLTPAPLRRKLLRNFLLRVRSNKQSNQSLNSCKIHQNCVFVVVIIGLYVPKPGSNLGYGRQNGVRIGLFTLKLDLWRVFRYMGFSLYGLFGRRAFRYRGFWVYGLFGSHPNKMGVPRGILQVLIIILYKKCLCSKSDNFSNASQSFSRAIYFSFQNRHTSYNTINI